MAKLTLTDITSGYALTTTVNANNALIEAALENTLSRDGSAPNTMSAALDMNSYAINNLPNATNNQQPVTLAQAATIAGVTNPLTRESVGTVFYPTTSNETAASVTPTTFYYPPGDLRRYGAAIDGTTDDTTAFQAAMDQGFVLPWDGIVSIDALSTTATTAIRGNGRTSTIKLRTPTVATTPGLIVGHTDCYIVGIHIDGNKTNRTLIRIDGDYCEVDVTTENVVALSTNESFVSGIDVNGGDYATISIMAENYSNGDPEGTGGHSNESVPRIITISDPTPATTGTHIKRCVGHTVNCGILIDGSGEHHAETVILEDANDQGIYAVNDGGIFTCSYFEYRGTGTVTNAGDEPIVVTTNGSINVDRVVIYGQTGHVIGVQDHTSCHIGHIDIEDYGVTTGTSPASIARTRTGNTAAGRLYIGGVTGKMRAQHLFQFSTGTIEYITIENLDVNWIYDASTAATLSQWAIFTSAKGFNFRNWRVKIIDEDDVITTEIFQAQAPTTNLTFDSFWKDIKIYLTNADGFTASSGEFRGVGLAASNIYVEGAEWVTSVGPRVREVGYGNGVPDSANQAPSAGTWRTGTMLRDSTPTTDGNNMTTVGWICTSGGTPGTWVAQYVSTVSPAT